MSSNKYEIKIESHHCEYLPPIKLTSFPGFGVGGSVAPWQQHIMVKEMLSQAFLAIPVPGFMMRLQQSYALTFFQIYFLKSSRDSKSSGIDEHDKRG